MKDYEARLRSYVNRRSSVILRIDGKSFHNYTRGLQKPFDTGLFDAMAQAAKYLCENIQGAKLGYMQSDEISILLTDYDDIKTDAWFDYQVEKMVSVSASLATTKFLYERIRQVLDDGALLDSQVRDRLHAIKLPSFDSRVLAMPNDEEVINYFIWRQQDAERNSIQALAQSMFSDKQLHGKNNSQMQDMMHEKGVNWNDCMTMQKRGVAVVKMAFNKAAPSNEGDAQGDCVRHEWYIDPEIPVFTKDKDYIRRVLPPRR